eukprot:c141_g1_i1.p1 GENE.c141_g1_i1~~c141_g1_i1.p1  ORF type:complete len:264 (-),score=45.46 c141_g1_i1:63-821(-)
MDGRVFRKGENKTVFGVPLLELELEDNVPLILIELTSHLFTLDGEHTEGIFRIPGNKEGVDTEKARLNNGETKLVTQDIHVAASLLKLWYRELPHPLIPQELTDACLKIATEPRETHATYVLNVLAGVPSPNLETCKYLIRTLQRINAHKEETKMTASNLATVFSPSLVSKAGEQTILAQMAQQLPAQSGNVKRSSSFQMMSQMTVDSDKSLQFVVALIEHLPPEEPKPQPPQQSQFMVWLSGLLGCASSRR